MQRLSRIQLIGPLVLCGAVLAAESAALALTQEPSSALLWYLNLEVFGAFRKSRALLGDIGGLPFAQLFLVAGPLTLLGIAGMALKRNLMVALSSNLSFIYAGFLLYSWHYWQAVGQVRSAALTFVYVPTGGNLYLFAVLLLASFLSFAASHFLYLRAMRTRN